MKYFEVSAATGENVEESLMNLIKCCLRQQTLAPFLSVAQSGSNKKLVAKGATFRGAALTGGTFRPRQMTVHAGWLIKQGAMIKVWACALCLMG